MTTKLLIAGVLLAGAITFTIAQENADTPPTIMERSPDITPMAPESSSPPDVGVTDDKEGELAQTSTMHHATMQVDKNFDKEYVTNAIKCNIFVIKLSETVAQKASEKDIKQFAQKLHDAHKKHLEELKQLAKNKNWDAPEKAAKWQQEYISEFSKLSTPQMERCFLFNQVGFHHAEVLANRFASKKAMDTDVRTIATRSLPELQRHLEMANRLTEECTGLEPQYGVTGR